MAGSDRWKALAARKAALNEKHGNSRSRRRGSRQNAFRLSPESFIIQASLKTDAQLLWEEQMADHPYTRREAEIQEFEIGDIVTTADTFDKSGPWKRMGDGCITNLRPPRARAKPGYVEVTFEEGGEKHPFLIKASNLRLLDRQEIDPWIDPDVQKNRRPSVENELFFRRAALEARRAERERKPKYHPARVPPVARFDPTVPNSLCLGQSIPPGHGGQQQSSTYVDAMSQDVLKSCRPASAPSGRAERSQPQSRALRSRPSSAPAGGARRGWKQSGTQVRPHSAGERRQIVDPQMGLESHKAWCVEAGVAATSRSASRPRSEERR